MGANLSYPDTKQSGKVAVVTGGNTGIGYETAKGLALLGAHVILACRSEEKAIGAIERMRGEVSQEHPDKTINVEFMSLDLSSLQSVKKFIEDYKQKGLPLHLLINNAGIAIVTEGKTEDGFERHFQVNHLGHFYLTLELLPIILSSAPDARIVFVSSDAHRIAFAFDVDNLQGQKGYDRMKQYGSSKLFNIMTGSALQRRVAGKGVTLSAIHPGIVATEIERNFTGHFTVQMINVVSKITGTRRTPKEGAATTLYAAVHPDLNKEEFVYYSSCKPAYMTQDARNERYQEQLWNHSCDLLQDYLTPQILREFRSGIGPLGQMVGGGETPDPTAGQRETPDPTAGQRETPDPTAGQRETPDPTAGQGETPDPTAGQGETPDQTAGQGETPDQTVAMGQGETPDQIVGEGETPDLTAGQRETPDPTAGQGETPDPTAGQGETPDPTAGQGETPDQTAGQGETPDQTVAMGQGETPDQIVGDGETPDPTVGQGETIVQTAGEGETPDQTVVGEGEHETAVEHY